MVVIVNSVMLFDYDGVEGDESVYLNEELSDFDEDDDDMDEEQFLVVLVVFVIYGSECFFVFLQVVFVINGYQNGFWKGLGLQLLFEGLKRFLLLVYVFLVLLIRFVLGVFFRLIVRVQNFGVFFLFVFVFVFRLLLMFFVFFVVFLFYILFVLIFLVFIGVMKSSVEVLR